MEFEAVWRVAGVNCTYHAVQEQPCECGKNHLQLDFDVPKHSNEFCWGIFLRLVECKEQQATGHVLVLQDKKVVNEGQAKLTAEDGPCLICAAA